MIMRIIIIPARLGSTRLPEKPLLKIKGIPLIQHVAHAAGQTGLRTVVATDDSRIFDLVESFGGEAIMTPNNLSCGTDRVAMAINALDPKHQYDEVINVQGDMPFIKPNQVLDSLKPLQHYDIGTLVYEMEPEQQANPNSVKAIVSLNGEIGQCHWFLRAPLAYGYHHAGIYAYRREALETFARIGPSRFEQLERLEQLRALEHGLTIGAYLSLPIAGEINTQEDLDQANR